MNSIEQPHHFKSEKVTIGNDACVGDTIDDGVSDDFDAGGRSCYRFGHDSDNCGSYPALIQINDGGCSGDSTLDSTEICQSCYAGVSLTTVIIVNSGDTCNDALAVA